MANELFTTREGQQIPVADLVVPKHIVVSLMRLREDHEARGEYLSLLGVLLNVIDKGTSQQRNQWKNGDLSKNRRDFAKLAAPYMVDTVKYSKEIKELAVRFGLVPGTPVHMASPEPPAEPELTAEELEAATAPETAAA